MAYLKDKNNNNVLPNTSAENVSYGNSNVAAKIAELEQGGGGGSTPSTDGVALPNIFTQDMVVSGYGTTEASGDSASEGYGQIWENPQMSCAFVPLDLDSYYCLDGVAFINQSNGNVINAYRSILALAKGSASSFTNLTEADFADGSQFKVNNDDFFTDNNLIYSAGKKNTQSLTPVIYGRDLPIVIKTPSAADLANPNTTIGIVFNVSLGNSSIDISKVHIVKGRYPVEYANSIKGKNMVFFGDSITEAFTHEGHVGIIWDALQLNRADNFGSTGGGAQRLTYIALGGCWRLDQNNKPSDPAGNQHRKDYSRYSAAVIQIGTNDTGTGMSGNEPASLDSLRAQADSEIPEVSVYDVMIGIARNGSYTYGTHTFTDVEDFFKQCFANSYFGNVALAIEYIQWKNPNCRVYLVTIPKNIGYANYKGINNCIMVLGEKLSVPVIDAANGALMTRENVTYWSRDDWKQNEITVNGTTKYRYRLTHPSETGMKMWGGFISSQLRSMYYDTDIDAFVVPSSASDYPDRPNPRNFNIETGDVIS